MPSQKELLYIQISKINNQHCGSCLKWSKGVVLRCIHQFYIIICLYNFKELRNEWGTFYLPFSVTQTCGARSSLWTPCCKELPPTRHPPPPPHLREARPRGEVQRHRRMHPHCNRNWHTDMLASQTVKNLLHVPALVIKHANADMGKKR